MADTGKLKQRAKELTRGQGDEILDLLAHFHPRLHRKQHATRTQIARLPGARQPPGAGPDHLDGQLQLEPAELALFAYEGLAHKRNHLILYVLLVEQVKEISQRPSGFSPGTKPRLNHARSAI